MNDTGRQADEVGCRLLTSAAQLFLESGYQLTGLSDIADRAGVDKTVVYQRFGSKDEIVAAMIDDLSVRYAKDVGELRARGDLDELQRLSRAIEELARRIAEEPVRLRALDRCEGSFPEHLVQRRASARASILDDLAAMILAAMSAGHLRPMDAKLAARFVVGLAVSQTGWYGPNDAYRPQQLAAEIATFAMTAMSRTGRAGEAVSANAIDQIRADIERLSEKIGE